MSGTKVVDNPELSRFEAYVDDKLAGYCDYEIEPDGVIGLPETVVFEQFQGQGVASELVGKAIASLAEAGKQIRPTCPFVVNWLIAHPGYDSMVVD